jgi:putative ABC transport system permease protein
MSLLKISFASIKNRKTTALLTILLIAISVSLLLGIEKIRTETKKSFQNTISGTDLIVGARSGPINLLLHTVFRMGNPTGLISWETYEAFKDDPSLEWAIPISLGDSFNGYPVVGTNETYFEHFKYRSDRNLEIAKGDIFSEANDAVLGANVAEDLGLELGSEIILAHGTAGKSRHHHDDHPFRVIGILERTGTPVDRSVHIPLVGMDKIHEGWVGGVPPRESKIKTDEKEHEEHEHGDHDHSHDHSSEAHPEAHPEKITAFFVSLKSKVMLFQFQRKVASYPEEPLSAIGPAATLFELWGNFQLFEKALIATSSMVLIASLLALLLVLLSTLSQRRREMAIFRSVGASPSHIFFLLLSEALILSIAGIALGVSLLFALLQLAQPLVAEQLGIGLSFTSLSSRDLSYLGFIFLAAVVAALVPALKAYGQTLNDGLSIKY